MKKKVPISIACLYGDLPFLLKDPENLDTHLNWAWLVLAEPYND